MPDNRTNKVLEFMDAMEIFISGRRRGTIFVREIEGMFAELFDDDERFEDLRYVLAMFGAAKDSRNDEDWLIREFNQAKRIIETEGELRRSAKLDMDNAHPKMPDILTPNINDPALVTSFLRAYRQQSQHIPSNVPTACLLKGKKGKTVVDLMPCPEDEEVFVYWDQGMALRKELIRNVAVFWESRGPWEDYDFCIFPGSLEWCIGFTHNDYCVLAKNLGN